MNIITRAQAKAASLNRYFTGVACKNGHIDYRYTASGACKSCIAQNNMSASTTNFATDPDVAAAKAALDMAAAVHAEAMRSAELRRQTANAAEHGTKQMEAEAVLRDVAAKQVAKAGLTRVRLRAFDTDREALAAAAWALAVMRYPVLTQGDVDPRLLPQDKTGGTALYAFNCHSDDVPTLRAIADGMLKGHRVDVVAVSREQALAAARNAPVAAVPDWADRP